MIGYVLTSGIHFSPILLVLKGDGYEGGGVEDRRSLNEIQTAIPPMKMNFPHAEEFRSAAVASRGVLATAAGEEERVN
jgi:hypothetical protein